jgi:DNA-binding transcriptional ArsR family regulator
MIAEIAALAGDPARANILTALLDGRAMTATELAYAARVTPQTTSAHLGKLVEAGMITATPSGRHRYFRLASPKVAQMLESIVAVAGDNRPRCRPLSRQAAALRAARVCYDHLAGQLGVRIADAMVTRGYLVLEDDGGRITDAGTRFLWELGIDTRIAGKGRRHLCRACLDWTERRDRCRARRALAGARLDRPRQGQSRGSRDPGRRTRLPRQPRDDGRLARDRRREGRRIAASVATAERRSGCHR